jgi:hypothetical protein
MVCTFLPWVSVPFFGSLSGTRGDGWITFGLCAAALVCALVGDLRAGLRLPAHLLSAGVGVVVCLIAIWKIIQFNSVVSDNGLSAVVSVGPGLYLLAVSGAAIALLPSLVRSGPPRPQPPVVPWQPPPHPGWRHQPPPQW